jgi:hypothetical protein
MPELNVCRISLRRPSNAFRSSTVKNVPPFFFLPSEMISSAVLFFSENGVRSAASGAALASLILLQSG